MERSLQVAFRDAPETLTRVFDQAFDVKSHLRAAKESRDKSKGNGNGNGNGNENDNENEDNENENENQDKTGNGETDDDEDNDNNAENDNDNGDGNENKEKKKGKEAKRRIQVALQAQKLKQATEKEQNKENYVEWNEMELLVKASREAEDWVVGLCILMDGLWIYGRTIPDYHQDSSPIHPDAATEVRIPYSS